MNFHFPGEKLVTISLDETTNRNDVLNIISVFGSSAGIDTSVATFDHESDLENIPASLTRTSHFYYILFQYLPQRN